MHCLLRIIQNQNKLTKTEHFIEEKIFQIMAKKLQSKIIRNQFKNCRKETKQVQVLEIFPCMFKNIR